MFRKQVVIELTQEQYEFVKQIAIEKGYKMTNKVIAELAIEKIDELMECKK